MFSAFPSKCTWHHLNAPPQGQFHLGAGSVWPGLTQMKVSQALGGGNSTTEGLAEIYTGRQRTKQSPLNMSRVFPTSLIDQSVRTCSSWYLAKNHSSTDQIQKSRNSLANLDIIARYKDIFAEGNHVKTKAAGRCKLLLANGKGNKEQMHTESLRLRCKQGHQKERSKEHLFLARELRLPTQTAA